MKGRGDGGGRPPDPRVLDGQRAELEREYMWAVALDGDPERIEQLRRMLMHAANDCVMFAAGRTDDGMIGSGGVESE